MTNYHRYEIEQKFRVAQLDSVLARLRELGADVAGIVEQADSYFTHPSRDFAATDEAFRLRRVGQSNYVTYKGPKIDTTTKTRREIELPLPQGKPYAEQFAGLLLAVGFSPLAVVKKQRRTASLDWHGQQVEVALDDVAQLGRFVEVELQGEESILAQARESVVSLADELQLQNVERRSYLEMLLALKPT